MHSVLISSEVSEQDVCMSALIPAVAQQLSGIFLACADRLFWSIRDTWRSVTTFPTDVKELIPEFYSTDTAFLTVSETADFGQRTSGKHHLAFCCMYTVVFPKEVNEIVNSNKPDSTL